MKIYHITEEDLLTISDNLKYIGDVLCDFAIENEKLFDDINTNLQEYIEQNDDIISEIISGE